MSDNNYRKAEQGLQTFIEEFEQLHSYEEQPKTEENVIPTIYDMEDVLDQLRKTND